MPVAEPGDDDTVWARTTDRADRVRSWGRRMSGEMVLLPDTMQRLREGATNFQLVSERLADATSALEEITSVYQSTIADSTRRVADVASALRTQVDTLSAGASPERLSSNLTDIQKTLESFAKLNPLWRQPRRPANPTQE